MKKETKAEKMAEHAETIQELKTAKKRLRQLARFVIGVEHHIYTTELWNYAEVHKLLVKNPKHPQGCQDSETCTGAAEDPCFTIAHWVREVAGEVVRQEKETESPG